MQTEHLKCLAALAAHRNLERAAEALGVGLAVVREAVASAEIVHGGDLVEARDAAGDVRFTPRGEAVLASARRTLSDLEALQQALEAARRRAAVAPLAGRRSISPKRLGLPGPDADALALMVEAALRGPDHGRLNPWRLIEFGRDSREQLASLFAAEKLRRDPLTPPADLARARAHALRPPVLLGFVVSPAGRSPVPAREQWLAAGAALGHLLAAAHQLGFGAIVLSGERCFDPVLLRQLGVQPHEALAGFVSIGTVLSQPGAARVASPAEVMGAWRGPTLPGDGQEEGAGAHSPSGTDPLP